MSKRKISDLLNAEPPAQSSTRPRLESDSSTPPQHSLSYQTNPPSQPLRPTPFQQPVPLLTFSYTPDRTLEFTDSAMRYYVDPPLGAQLSYGYDRWVRKPETRGRIDGLLKGLCRAREMSGGGGEVGVVAWRGVMTKILTAPYEDREGWEMNVMCMDGTMYFEEHLTESKLQEKENMESHHRLQSYYGYAFESYCTSHTPHRQPNLHSSVKGWGGDVDTNVQWCSVVKTKLGDTRMIIGGEVDCVRDRYSGSTDTFVELKTSMYIRGPQDRPKFEKKLLKFYFQSFLLGVPEILVGFRTPSGEITTIESFKTIQLPRLVRGKPGAWDPIVCLDWGHGFLTFLKGIVYDEQPEKVWRVKFIPRTGVSIEVLDGEGVLDVEGGEERVGLLPQWYWDKVKSGQGKAQDSGPVGSSPGLRRPSVVKAPPGWQI